MRAVALFHPRVDRGLLRRFPGAEYAESLPDCTDAALIFGGDGTMHRYLPRLVESGTPALVVPAGSGNDFAHAVGIHSIDDAARAWQSFTSSRASVGSVDVAEIRAANDQRQTTNDLYCCVAGVGLDSEVNRRANALPPWLRRRGGYVAALLPALLRFRAPRVTVEALDASSGETIVRISESAMLCAFANAPAYGDGMRIAPRAIMDDGLLDICFVRRLGKVRLLRLFPKVFAGAHLGMHEVRYLHAARLRVESDPPLDIFADGEFIARTPAEISVRSRALRIITPDSA